MASGHLYEELKRQNDLHNCSVASKIFTYWHRESMGNLRLYGKEAKKTNAK